MNIELFEELQRLISKKKEYQDFIKHLKGKPYLNKIILNKGLITMYFEDDLIPILIEYYEEEIKKIDNTISKFKLTKFID